MARPHVLLCGRDNWHRFDEFWMAGFAVDLCQNEVDLVRWLLYGKATDVICVLEAEDRPVDETTMELVKSYTDVPLVLFRIGDHADSHGLWSLEVLPGTTSRDWIRGIQGLVGRPRPAEPGPLM